MRNKALLEWVNLGHTTVPNGLLIYYTELGLTNDDLVTLIQLLSMTENGYYFPDSQLLAERLDIPREDAYKAIHRLMTKKVITIETKENEDGKSIDEFSFDLLHEKLFLLLEQKNQDLMDVETVVSSKELYRLFEEEFGRALSSIEIQTLSIWLNEDKYSAELIQMALREAVLNQVYSLKYIDRILLTWEKKNIRTKDQVEKEAKRRRSQQTQNNQPNMNTPSNPDEKPVPMYNWLKNKFEND